MSDHSSGASSSEDDERRSALIAEIPSLEAPRLPEPKLPDLSGFREEHPREPLDGLSDNEVEDRISWAEEIRANLQSTLNALTDEYRAEWLAKEQLLDDLFKKELGADAPLLPAADHKLDTWVKRE